MDDADWLRQREGWERVKWARLRWQRLAQVPSESARAAAESLGMQENTYSAYERDPARSSKGTELTVERAQQFGRKFKVNWVWLLTGEETPFDRSPAQIRAVEAMRQLPEQDQEAVANAVEGLVSGLRRVA